MKPEQIFKTYLQNDNKNLFHTFNVEDLNINWKQVSILDYGCNQGNFLKSAAENINSDEYLGIDIIPLAVETARLKNPGYQFLHYDKWHQAYNPSGDKNLKITDVLNKKFDVIICYSVFTHTTIEQTDNELNELKKLLNPNGVILFTVWRSEVFEPFYKWILQRFENVVSINFDDINYQKMAYWLDTSTVITDTLNFETDNNNSFNTFYNIEWFKEEFKSAIHLGVPTNQHQDLFCLKN
jgi:SAM-dependent methyltransferase